jgi:large subunit ribosomal protein L25
MTAAVSLNATARERVGKGAARAERRAGRIPAVIYGDKRPAEPIVLDRRDVIQQLNAGHFLTTVYEIEVGGTVNRVLPRDVQYDPVKDMPVHIDFLRLAAGATIDVWIPVTFVNEEDSPGLRRGGVLNVVRHEVELSCPVDAIPDELVADLTGLDLGDSLHISAIPLPEGTTPTITDRDFTVATIAAPAGLKSEEEEAEEAEALAAEGEEAEAEAAEETEEPKEAEEE